MLGNCSPTSGRMVSRGSKAAVRAAETGCPPPETAHPPTPPLRLMVASLPFQTRSGDPPSAPEASAKVGTRVLAPESDIPEAPRSSLPTPDSWQNRRAGASGRCAGQGPGAECGGGRGLWEGPGSGHLSTGSGRSLARDRTDPHVSPGTGHLPPLTGTQTGVWAGPCRLQNGVWAGSSVSDTVS